jgi:hypothetical protein
MMISAMHIYGGYTNKPHERNLPPHNPAPTYYYKMLGDAFLAGHTNVTPYTLWDVEHYKGKFYLYFGPAPALFIWVPVKLVTGIALSDPAMNWITVTIGSCCLFLLMYLIALRQQFTDIPGLLICWLAIGFSKWTFPCSMAISIRQPLQAHIALMRWHFCFYGYTSTIKTVLGGCSLRASVSDWRWEAALPIFFPASFY